MPLQVKKIQGYPAFLQEWQRGCAGGFVVVTDTVQGNNRQHQNTVRLHVDQSLRKFLA